MLCLPRKHSLTCQALSGTLCEARLLIKVESSSWGSWLAGKHQKFCRREVLSLCRRRGPCRIQRGRPRKEGFGYCKGDSITASSTAEGGRGRQCRLWGRLFSFLPFPFLSFPSSSFPILPSILEDLPRARLSVDGALTWVLAITSGAQAQLTLSSGLDWS